jgi:hypothetical protein
MSRINSPSSRFVSVTKALRGKPGRSPWDTAAERVGGAPRWDGHSASPVKSHRDSTTSIRPQP